MSLSFNTAAAAASPDAEGCPTAPNMVLGGNVDKTNNDKVSELSIGKVTTIRNTRKSAEGTHGKTENKICITSHPAAIGKMQKLELERNFFSSGGAAAISPFGAGASDTDGLGLDCVAFSPSKLGDARQMTTVEQPEAEMSEHTDLDSNAGVSGGDNHSDVLAVPDKTAQQSDSEDGGHQGSDDKSPPTSDGISSTEESAGVASENSLDSGEANNIFVLFRNLH